MDWRTCWRDSLAPSLPLRGLLELRRALVADSRQLCQRQTVDDDADGSIRACCPLAFVLWKGHLYDSPTALRFAVATYAPTSAPFISWVDDTPRHELRGRLLHEVELALIAKTGLEETAEAVGALEQEMCA